MAAMMGQVPCRLNNLWSHPKSLEKTGISSRQMYIHQLRTIFAQQHVTERTGPMHRMGLASSCRCECGLGMEDAHHFFLRMFLIRQSAT